MGYYPKEILYDLITACLKGSVFWFRCGKSHESEFLIQACAETQKGN